MGIENGIYRNISDSDYQIIADYSNINAESEKPLWCKTHGWDKTRVSGFIEKFTDKKLVSQTHEVNGKIISCFAGWEYKDRTMFELGVVDTALTDCFDIWRQDTAILFKTAFDRGSKYIHIRLTDDTCQLVAWMENELKMTRHHTHMIWTGSKEDIKPYIDQYLPL